jgi:hypothetical protein
LELVITPLGKRHDRRNFVCGETPLVLYLHRYANHDIRRRVNRVFVASPPGEPQRVIGYYSLSAGSLAALSNNRRREKPAKRGSGVTLSAQPQRAPQRCHIGTEGLRRPIELPELQKEGFEPFPAR